MKHLSTPLSQRMKGKRKYSLSDWKLYEPECFDDDDLKEMESMETKVGLCNYCDKEASNADVSMIL